MNSFKPKSRKNLFSFSISKEIITPPKFMYPLKLSGFAARKGLTTEVHDDIYVKAVLLKANRFLLLITYDLTSGSVESCDSIKAVIKKKYGIQPCQILINFSHSHSSVSFPSLNPDDYQDGIERISTKATDFGKYGFFVLKKTMLAVEHCFKTLEPGDLYMKKAKTKVGVSRRLVVGNNVFWKPAWKAIINNDIFLLKLVNKKKKIKSIIYNFGCHPSSLGPYNLLLSNDIIGFANQYLEQSFKDAIPVFLQGSGGDVKPICCAKRASGKNRLEDTFISLSMDQGLTEKGGKNLAKEITLFVRKGTFTKIKPSFRNAKNTVEIIGPKPDIEALKKLIKQEESKRWSDNLSKYKQVLANCQNKKYNLRKTLYMAMWYLSDDLRIVGLSCEATSEVGKIVKNVHNDGRTMLLGYTNGVVGYVASAKQYKEGGYEAMSFVQWGLAGPPLPLIDKIIGDGVKVMDFDCRKEKN